MKVPNKIKLFLQALSLNSVTPSIDPMKRSASLVAFLLITLQVSATDRRLVLIAGRPSHPPGMHEFRGGCLLFQKCLAGQLGLQVQVYSNGWPTRVTGDKVEDDNSLIATADAVVVYADGGGGHPAIRPDRVKVLDALAARGGGLGFAHYGVEVPTGDPAAAMKRWIGGHYEDRYSVNPMWSPKFSTFPKHPISRGVKPFSTRDEWYFNMRWAEGTQPATWLLSDSPTDSVRNGPYVWPAGPYAHVVAATGRREAMMWTIDRADGGRGLGFTGGHTHANWGDENQRKIFLNALLWLVKMEIPSNGFESQLSPQDLAGNLDPKKK